jgi:hypothetical protein
MKIYLTELEIYGNVYSGPNIIAATLEQAELAANKNGLVVVGELENIVVNDDVSYPSTVKPESKRIIH